MQAFLARFSHFFKKAPLLKEQLPCSDFFKEETRRKKAKYGKVEVIDQGGFFTMENCIFCKINNREIPSYKVYEDEQVYAFLDISQVTPGHTLVIPKTHVTDIFEYDETLAAAVFARIPKIARAIEKAFPEIEGLNTINNNKELAYQSVFHSHVHLIPRYSKDDDFKIHFGNHADNYTGEELAAIAEKIGKQVD